MRSVKLWQLTDVAAGNCYVAEATKFLTQSNRLVRLLSHTVGETWQTGTWGQDKINLDLDPSDCLRLLGSFGILVKALLQAKPHNTKVWVLAEGSVSTCKCKYPVWF